MHLSSPTSAASWTGSRWRSSWRPDGVDVFGLLGVASRLEDRLGLLTHGRRTALPRHQTLAATLDWSYDALPESEQAALRRLSVFAGGFTLDGAQAVATDDLVAPDDIVEIVASLVSKSLLNADVTTAIGHYRLLDTTRAYALNKLAESGEFDETARRHATYIQYLLKTMSSDAVAPSSTGGAARLPAESRLIDEARAVIDWAFSDGRDIETGVALTVASASLYGPISPSMENAAGTWSRPCWPAKRASSQLIAGKCSYWPHWVQRWSGRRDQVPKRTRPS